MLWHDFTTGTAYVSLGSSLARRSLGARLVARSSAPSAATLKVDARILPRCYFVRRGNFFDLASGRTEQPAFFRARRSRLYPVNVSYASATSLNVGLSPRKRPFCAALAVHHAVRILAVSSALPDFRFLADFRSNASAI